MTIHDQGATKGCQPYWIDESDMRVQDVPVQPIRVRWLCPVDGCPGEMRQQPITWSTNPAGHHHQCDNVDCLHTAVPRNGKSYPRIEYR